MSRLSEYEQYGAIVMLKAGVRVSDVASYHNCLGTVNYTAPQRSLPDYRDR